jgi:hypothetical protein
MSLVSELSDASRQDMILVGRVDVLPRTWHLKRLTSPVQTARLIVSIPK